MLICNSPTFPQLLVPNFPRIRRFSARISAQIEEQLADLIATGSSGRQDRKFRPRTGSSAHQDRNFRLAEIFTANFVFRFGTNPLCLDFVVCAISDNFRNIIYDDGTPRIQAVHFTPSTIASSSSSATVIKWYNLHLTCSLSFLCVPFLSRVAF